MPRKIDEPFVKKAVQKYLDRKQYRMYDYKELHEHGPDLTMVGRNNGRRITIEAKGETGAKAEQETILLAMGQMLTRFRKHPNHFHGLAFPYTWRSRVAKKINLDAVRALNLVIYLVDEHGSVSEFGKRAYKAFLHDAQG